MEKFVSIKEASKFLDVKQSTIYCWRHRGCVPCYKIKGRLLFRLSELNRFVESSKQPVLTKSITKIAG